MSRKYWGWWNNSDSDDDVVEESSPIIYGKRYKSSLGWSSGKLASTTTSYTSNYYGYGYDKFYSSSITSFSTSIFSVGISLLEICSLSSLKKNDHRCEQ
jgi:hypothetical protein